MSELEHIDAPHILGITDQQLGILQSIYKITAKNKTATPRDIEITYQKDHGDGIQKSNLFRQLKILQDKKFINRHGEANYQLNFDDIKKTLDTRKTEYHKKLEQYDTLSNDIEDYFDKFSFKDPKPVVEYLDHTPFFLKIASTSRHSKRLYTAGRFANITYTPRLIDSLERGDAFREIHDLCYNKKKLEVTYLSNFDVNYLYGHAIKLYGDHEWAYRECEIIIDGLKELSERDNLNLIYVDDLPGLHLILPEKDQPNELLLYLRDNKGEIIGGVYLKSPETARSAKEMYLKEYDKGVNLQESEGDKIIKKIKGNLKREYGGKKGKKKKG